MADRLSKTQVDRLGDRLRSGSLDVSDFILLDEYRRSFGKAYEHVIRAIRDQLGLAPTGRHAKTATSLVEKLQRESIRLSQVQDIAGCRIVVGGCTEQNQVVNSLCDLFSDTTVVDRRKKPSHGYRAVHVIARIEGKPVEIQIRTSIQHLWAEFSEKMADVVGHAIKYGGGDDKAQELLIHISVVVEAVEDREQKIAVIAHEITSRKQRNAALLENPSLQSTEELDLRERNKKLESLEEMALAEQRETDAEKKLLCDLLSKDIEALERRKQGG